MAALTPFRPNQSQFILPSPSRQQTFLLLFLSYPRYEQSLAPSKKTRVFPAIGQPLRGPAETARTHHLLTEVTAAEKKLIVDYCLEHRLSISQYLAELILQDATQHKQHDKITVTYNIPGQEAVTLPIDPNDADKLELWARAQGKSLAQLMHGRLTANLPERPTNNLTTDNLRYYLSEKEHRIVTKYITHKGVSGRKYVSLLAIKDIQRRRLKS
jgi:hypothetical protein